MNRIKKLIIVCSFALICVLGFSACGKVDAGTTKTKVDKPTSELSFVYSGTEKSPLSSFDATLINVTGDTTATAAGDYTFTVSLKDTTKYTWTDGTTAAYDVNWEITPRLDSMTLVTAPSVTVTPGKDLVYNFGKVMLTYSDGIVRGTVDKDGFPTSDPIENGYNNLYFQKIVDCEKEWVTFDLAAKTYNENLGKYTYGTYSINYGNMSPKNGSLKLPETAVVSTSADLMAALKSSTATLILVNGGTYNIDNAVNHDAAYVKTGKVIIGTGNVVVNVTGTLSENAIVIFQDSVTLKNIKIICEGNQNAVKVSNLPNPSQLIQNVYFENVTISGAKGLNLHGVANAVLNNITVNVEPTTGCVALNLREATVTMTGSTIKHGSWGSVGLMFGASDTSASKLTLGEGNSFTGNMYIEKQTTLGSTIVGINWESDYISQTQIYYNPALL